MNAMHWLFIVDLVCIVLCGIMDEYLPSRGKM